MVSPGTHLVKNHESQSRTNEPQFKKKWVPGSFVTIQLIWRQTPKLQITVIYSFYCKAQQRLKEMSRLTTATRTAQAQKSHKQTRKTSLDWSIDLSLRPIGCIPQIILCLWGFLCVRDAGHGGNKITEGCNIFFSVGNTPHEHLSHWKNKWHLSEACYVTAKMWCVVIRIKPSTDLKSLNNWETSVSQGNHLVCIPYIIYNWIAIISCSIKAWALKQNIHCTLLKPQM